MSNTERKNGLSRLFAAKSDREGKWECVPQHHSDTAGVMKLLCDPFSGWVSPAFIKATGLDEELFCKVCVFAAAVHDIGKLTPSFQRKIGYSLNGLIERLSDYGFDVSTKDEGEDYHHAFLSGAILNTAFGIEETVCEVIAAHHGSPRGRGREFKWVRPFKYFSEKVCGKSGEYEPLWEETIGYAEFISGIKRYELPKLSLGAQILISGLLIFADWISSNESYFPLEEPWEVSYEKDTDRIERGYAASGVKRGWYPQTFMYDDSVFGDRFGFFPNEMQKTAGMAVNAGARFMIVEGSMGSGKTESAFMCSEVMAANNASGGFYIGLPTMATANGIFPRMLKWARRASCHLPVTAGLSHGSAMFNKEYAALMVNTGENDQDNISVNQWMTGRHRKIMSDFVDGTIDQAICMALNRRYFMMLHSQIAGKVVVLDEIHSYDAYTNGYIRTTLSYLGVYGCPVILLSATLTEEKKAEFIKAYTGNNKLEIQASPKYPCTTWWDGEKLHVDAVQEPEQKKRKVRIRKADVSDVTEIIKEKLSDGGCAGIIRNTVNTAVDTYMHIKQILPGYRIVLLHSRFLSDDRAAIENDIIKLTGKDSTEKDRDGLIIVGTQVLEQSLDLDFDLMFTDLCPTDLFFQRIGREHRHERKRPRKLADAEVYILTDGGKVAAGGNDRPYNSYILRKSLNVIEKTGGTVLVPDDVKRMVEDTYKDDPSCEDQDYEEYKSMIENKEGKSDEMRIPDPWNAKRLSDFAKQDARSADEDYGVRDGSGSINAIMLKIKNGCVMDVNETVSCKVGDLPDEYTGAVFLRQTITVPDHMVPLSEMTRMKKETGFGDESLWKYKNMIIMDEDNCCECTVNGEKKQYCYSKEIGFFQKR